MLGLREQVVTIDLSVQDSWCTRCKEVVTFKRIGKLKRYRGLLCGHERVINEYVKHIDVMGKKTADAESWRGRRKDYSYNRGI